VLPSPPIGIPFLQPVDPPWMPRLKTKVEEVTLNQEEHVVRVFILFFFQISL
jgi:hypothetical protein